MENAGENHVADGNTTMSVYTTSFSNCNFNGYPTKGGSEKLPSYDPFKMRDKNNGTTAKGALLHLMKSSIGTGILAMPNAFKNSGLLFGLFGTVIIGMLCTHCIYLLVVCSQALARRTRQPFIGFADTAFAAFTTGPQKFRFLATFARSFVNVALFCTYYFGNCVYVILISASFKQVVDNHTEWHFSIRTWIMGVALPFLPLGIIRSLRLLVPFSAAATTFILVGLGCTIAWVVIGASPFADGSTPAVPLPAIGSRPWIASIDHMPLFFATVLFAMEGIGTVLPIENSMSEPHRFLKGRPCSVLNTAMTLVVVLYATAGFLGYLRFGDTTEGSITLNLPKDVFSETVKIMVTLSILFSYGLQFCVPSEIAWARLEPWLRKTINYSVDDEGIVSKSVGWMYYVMRASMILVTFCIAAIVPNLAPIISLFGAVFFSILGLFCPAIIHLVTFWEHKDEDGEDGGDDDLENAQTVRKGGRRVMSLWTAFKDVAIAIAALVALVSGAYTSLLNIVAFYGAGDGEDKHYNVTTSPTPSPV